MKHHSPHQNIPPSNHNRYPSSEGAHDHAMMHGGPEMAKDFLRRFYIVTVLLIPLFPLSSMARMLFMIPEVPYGRYLEFGLATAIFYVGLVFFQHAWMEIKMKQYGMMTLVSLGVGAGYLFSAAATFIPTIDVEFYLEIATLIWILLLGHYLEAKSSSAASNALAEVAKLLPKLAHKITPEGAVDVEIDQLVSGDVVIVKPGEKVPADGVIAKGQATFNEAHITGESKPIEKGPKALVAAGAINLDGTVEIRLTKVGEHSTIGQIQKLIASAQQTKPKAQRLADRVSQWLTFSALFVAVFALLIWTLVFGQTFVFALTLAITVLVIACPHALGLAIPTVSTIATRLAVTNGIFIKDMGKLEVIKDVTYVVFDKTGTLTKGEFGVTDIFPLSSRIGALQPGTGSGLNEGQDLLTLAASLEQASSHMIGNSIVEAAKKDDLRLSEVTEIKNLAGKGIQGSIHGSSYWIGNQKLMEELGVMSHEVKTQFDRLANQGKTTILLATHNKVVGIIALSDQIKPESRQAIEELHRLGIKVAMLTGDHEVVAQAVAKELKIDTVFAQVLPEDKFKHIKSLQDNGEVVLMAGDGVNDAPALTQANAGVAIGAGTDVAVEAGDIILTQSNPQHIVRLIILARKVYSKMVQNLLWATGYNVLVIPAAAGLFVPWGLTLTPAFGAILMSLSSVLVVVNALTLRKAKLEI